MLRAVAGTNLLLVYAEVGMAERFGIAPVEAGVGGATARLSSDSMSMTSVLDATEFWGLNSETERLRVEMVLTTGLPRRRELGERIIWR